MKTLPYPDAADRPRNDVSALVDIAFLLLIFFLVSTTILPTERDLPLAVPTESGEPAPTISPAVITIDRNGAVTWGEVGSAMQVAGPADGRELPELRAALATAAAAGGDEGRVVLLRSSGEAPQQRFIDVLDALTASGVSRIVLDEADQ